MITLQHEDRCAGCGSCSEETRPESENALLSGRTIVLGSLAFFLGPVALAIVAAALFDDGGVHQFAAAFLALAGGVGASWWLGRLLGFSGEEES